MIELPGASVELRGSTRTLLSEAQGVVKRSVTEHGMRIISEQMPACRSATVGIWVPVGSRDESVELAGASHFLEHLLFKGTATRTALEISAAIDAVGGDLNAFTTKEYTCFYARVLDRDIPLAMEVLLDAVLQPLLREQDIESERQVVLEEIAMYDDDPASVAHEQFAIAVFAGTPLAPPIIGTPASIAEMPAERVRSHYRSWYHPSNLVVSIAGGINHEQVVDVINRTADRVLQGVDVLPDSGQHMRDRARAAGQSAPLLAPEATELHLTRPLEQSNIIIGYPGFTRLDPRRHAYGVMSAALGGGMSSRLFQEVREERGLAYSVSSFRSRYSDAGAFGVYAGTSQAKCHDTISVIDQVLDDVRRHGLTEAEVERGKGGSRGSMVLAMEESSSRMMALGEAETVTGRLVPLAEAIAAIDAVTTAEVAEVAATIFAGPRILSTVGPQSGADE